MNKNILTSHLQKDCYGDFLLTNAIRPSVQNQVIPREGYRLETYRDEPGDLHIPVLAASISREKLFDVFLDMLGPVGDMVDVVLETSHDRNSSPHRDLHREGIDLPVLQSHLYDFEDLLLNDGCTGIAVISGSEPIEVQFDEHKLIVVYAENLIPFESILADYDLSQDDELKLITEGEHLHNTTTEFASQFETLCYRIGAGESVESISW